MKLECEMRLPVAQWLLARGLAPVCEVGCLRNCDMVGVRFEEKPVRLAEMVAVELKLRDVAGVLRQCESHVAREVTEVWAAMLPEMARKHWRRFDAIGVGMLSVTAESVLVISPACRNTDRDLSRWKPAMRRRCREHVWRMKNENMMRLNGKVASAT